jgi:two-component system sensor histidine kinase YesM
MPAHKHPFFHHTKNGVDLMRMPSFSWRQKLITTSLLCLFIPSVITLTLTGLYTNNELKNKTTVKSEQSLEVADFYVSNIIRDMINVMNTIQYDSEMITNLRMAWNSYEKNGIGKADFFSNKSVMDKVDQLTLFGGYTYVTILLPDGLYYSNYSTFQNDLSFMYKEPWLLRMDKDPVNTTNWVGLQKNYVHSEASQYPNLITIVRNFQLYSNAPNAYIILSKPEEQLHEIFNKYAQDQTMMLFDSNRKILSASDISLIGRYVPASFLTAGKAERTNWDGQEYLSVNHPLAIAGWSMQSLTHYGDVTGKIGNILNDVFVLQVLFFVVFSVVMFYLLRQLLKPIIQLAKTAVKVESGNLNVRSQVKGQDEIGHLGLSFDRMLDRIKQMIQQIQWEQERKRMAEIDLLQAQINPHFLFNTLNSIRLRVMMKGEKEIAEIVGSLSTLLRMTINRNNEFLPLHEEVSTVEQYMKLMDFRHHENIEFTVNLASDTLLATLPRFTLQPIIENAYIHGLRQKHGSIKVSSWKMGHLLFISVQDNGIGMNEEELSTVKEMLMETGKRGEPFSGAPSRINGIGLKNVNERLSIIYGDAYELELESSPGHGLKLTLRLPITVRVEESDDV